MKKTDMYIGQQVANAVADQRICAVVAGFHEVTGDPILMDEHGNRWLADADKCEAVAETGIRHKNGFVVFA